MSKTIAAGRARHARRASRGEPREPTPGSNLRALSGSSAKYKPRDAAASGCRGPARAPARCGACTAPPGPARVRASRSCSSQAARRALVQPRARSPSNPAPPADDYRPAGRLPVSPHARPRRAEPPANHDDNVVQAAVIGASPRTRMPGAEENGPTVWKGVRPATSYGSIGVASRPRSTMSNR